jgi:hypothetical protein
MKRIALCLLLLTASLPAQAEAPEQTAAKIIAGVELLVNDPADQLRNFLVKQKHYHDRGLASRKPEDFRISLAIAARIEPLLGKDDKAREQMLSFQARSLTHLCTLVSRPDCGDLAYDFHLNPDREAWGSKQKLKKARAEALAKAKVADPVFNKNIVIKNRWLAAIYLDALGTLEGATKKRLQADKELKAVLAIMQPGTSNWALACKHRGTINLELALKFKAKKKLAQLEKTRAIFEGVLERMATPHLERMRAIISAHLANTLIAMSQNRTDLVSSAYSHAAQSSTFFDRYADPWLWAYATGNRGVARTLMAEFENKAEWRKEAIEDMQAAIKIMKKQKDNSSADYFEGWVHRASTPDKKQTITL